MGIFEHGFKLDGLWIEIQEGQFLRVHVPKVDFLLFDSLEADAESQFPETHSELFAFDEGSGAKDDLLIRWVGTGEGQLLKG